MLRIIRTTTLATLRADLATAEADATVMSEKATRWHGLYEEESGRVADAVIREGDTRAELEEARAEVEKLREELARAEGELTVLRAQHLLDTEDRATLRALLRTARKQRADRVFALFRRGALHSIHATHEAAEAAAEAEGAPREGWTTVAPGAALPPASEVDWRVQPLPLGGV
ncbi:hypothetical protein [Streptomyces megasporus]|uniref:hypothetical protein n=1 Tax=Streptomyces megasporus TaxID=44060 RepID=UPI0004E23D69|nr:hypothetical protein [Streptomyces megasporus]